MNLTKDGAKYYISLNRDEYINESLLKICNDENIQSGWISGVGAIYDIEVGYYDVYKQDYLRKTFDDDYELLSLSGNLTIKEGNKFIHTHIAFSGTDFKAYGGHLFDAKIAAAGEFMIDSGKININRKYNSEIGLHLWCIEND
tara:strand:+ start:29 stop:457 length:429 start_codon:yes stop_codon:yes gene_type:complete